MEKLSDVIKNFFSKKHEVVEVVEIVEKNHDIYMLEDGRKCQVSALEVGATIEFILEDGSLEGADPGKYKLEDGKVIVVEEKGIIADVKEAEEEAEEESTEDTVEMAAEEMSEIKNSIVYLAERLSKLEGERDLVKAENEKLKAENEALKNAPVPAKKKIEFKKLAEKSNVKKGKYSDIVAEYSKK